MKQGVKFIYKVSSGVIPISQDLWDKNEDLYKRDGYREATETEVLNHFDFELEEADPKPSKKKKKKAEPKEQNEEPQVEETTE